MTFSIHPGTFVPLMKSVMSHCREASHLSLTPTALPKLRLNQQWENIQQGQKLEGTMSPGDSAVGWAWRFGTPFLLLKMNDKQVNYQAEVLLQFTWAKMIWSPFRQMCFYLWMPNKQHSLDRQCTTSHAAKATVCLWFLCSVNYINKTLLCLRNQP